MPTTKKKSPQPAQQTRRNEERLSTARRVAVAAPLTMSGKAAQLELKFSEATPKAPVKAARKVGAGPAKASVKAPTVRASVKKIATKSKSEKVAPKVAGKMAIAVVKAPKSALPASQPEKRRAARPKEVVKAEVVKPAVSSQRSPKSEAATKKTVKKPEKSAVFKADKVPAAKVPKSAPNAKKAVVQAKAPMTAKKPLPVAKTAAPRKALKSASPEPIKNPAKPALENAAPVKATRKRVPADFALQYGESAARKPRQTAEVVQRRPRRDAILRQKMRDVIEPGDELVARLRRAGAIGGGEVEENTRPARRIATAPRRPRKWEARCGKCGNKSVFLTQAGLCARCGAIMVRETL